MFLPVSVKGMTRNERLKAQMAMMLLTEKRCGKIKGRMVFDSRKHVNGLPKKIQQTLPQHWREYC